jgi:long-chain fatty acid transport protein
MVALMAIEAIAGGYSVSAVGARARSMGGAFRAVADDWSAVYYNPAGLAKIEESQLNLTLGFDRYRPGFDPDVTANGYGFGFPTGERYPDDVLTFAPNFNAIGAAPFGFPLTEPYDENLTWDLYRFPEGYDSLQGKLPGIDYRNDLDVVDFRWAIATTVIQPELDMELHAGVGFTISRGDIYSNQMFLKPNPVEDERLNRRPYEYIADWGMMDVHGIGWGLNVGLLLDISDFISVGASYQSNIKIDMDGDGVSRLYTVDNRYILNNFGEWEDEEGVDSLFSGHTYVSTSEIDASMTLPPEFGIGLALHPSEYVTLAADFAITRWSEFKDIEVEYKSSIGLSQWPVINDLLLGNPHPYDWENSIRLSFGIEGQPSDKLKLRGGYSFDESPIPDEQAMPLISDTGDRHHIAGGISYFYNKFEFAFAGEIVAMPERDVTGLSDINDDGIWDNLAGTYSNTAFNTSFSVTLRF